MQSTSDCLVSESQVLTKNKQPVRDALIQLMTEEGQANIGYTDVNGKIVFFTETSEALWLSSLVEAELAELKSKEEKSYSSINALLRVCSVSIGRKHV